MTDARLTELASPRFADPSDGDNMGFLVSYLHEAHRELVAEVYRLRARERWLSPAMTDMVDRLEQEQAVVPLRAGWTAQVVSTSQVELYDTTGNWRVVNFVRGGARYNWLWDGRAVGALDDIAALGPA